MLGMRKFACCVIAALLASAGPVTGQSTTPSTSQSKAKASAPGAMMLNDAGYYEAPAVNVLVFSNWYDGLFADSKISGVEIIQQGERIATNGDIRLSATPGQWDAIGRLVDRKIDAATGAVTVTLEYPDHKWRYRVRSERRGGAVAVSVLLDTPVPAALAGKAGFNLEFLPSAYFHHSYMADGRTGTFPLYPADAMTTTATRNAASGRNEGPGAEPTAIAQGSRFVLAPEDPRRRVTISSTAPVQLFDGRNQAQNGWFVLRSLLPAARTGKVLEWTIQPNSVPGWLRPPVIAHSQLGYTPAARKIATIELDRNDARSQPTRLLRVGEDGRMTTVKTTPATRWGDYLRYRYRQLDFSAVREPGLYVLEHGETRTAPFRIAADVYAGTWHPTLDVYFPVAMDHMFVNEGYRVRRRSLTNISTFMHRDRPPTPGSNPASIFRGLRSADGSTRAITTSAPSRNIRSFAPWWTPGSAGARAAIPRRSIGPAAVPRCMFPTARPTSFSRFATARCKSSRSSTRSVMPSMASSNPTWRNIRIWATLRPRRTDWCTIRH
jgi:endoglucanase